ncbi:hypothetical protein QBC34DRAFT_209000 [Podospora aff. communis PSN243]|uniref:Type II protein arginine methyltransferase n=1 Tax=Podospora aff. communis PSN243 TaxID=3040156 RepID=A0AAV9H0L9_9PEZI|nr:hypothetical protein QBC34DRAFT_209000 [Podospora aff. communis PSN243]
MLTKRGPTVLSLFFVGRCDGKRNDHFSPTTDRFGAPLARDWLAWGGPGDALRHAERRSSTMVKNNLLLICLSPLRAFTSSCPEDGATSAILPSRCNSAPCVLGSADLEIEMMTTVDGVRSSGGGRLIITDYGVRHCQSFPRGDSAIADHPNSGRVPFEKQAGGATGATTTVGWTMAALPSVIAATRRHTHRRQSRTGTLAGCMLVLELKPWEEICTLMTERHMHASRRQAFGNGERHI